jgi:hypothetical protein
MAGAGVFQLMSDPVCLSASVNCDSIDNHQQTPASAFLPQTGPHQEKYISHLGSLILNFCPIKAQDIKFPFTTCEKGFLSSPQGRAN